MHIDSSPQFGSAPTPASRAPAGLPQLGRGRHSSAGDGACLMEYTSVLAGAAFSDHPRCTAPTLATLARLVNDASSDAARPQLGRYAPELTVRPRLSAAESATVVAAVLSAVADVLDGLDDAARPASNRRIRRLRRQACRERTRAAAAGHPGRGAWVRAGEVLHRTGSARLRLESAVRALEALDVPARDRALADLLTESLRGHPGADVPPTRSSRGSTTTGDDSRHAEDSVVVDLLPIW